MHQKLKEFGLDLSGILSLLNETTLRGMYQHARETYPNECCGVLHRSGVRRCRNVQDELHAHDPVAFPRTARQAFSFAAADVLLMAESFDTADPVVAVYHSHVDCGAYFSKADETGALWNGEPVYPGLFHLVIDCRRCEIGGAKLFAYDGKRFVEAAVFPGALV